MQAAGSWSVDACCAVAGNQCHRDNDGTPYECVDRASSSDWLFGLWPGPPQRFEPTGTGTIYQRVTADEWPEWGNDADLVIGESGAPGGYDGYCHQGGTYRGTRCEICGGAENWGATDVEVWTRFDKPSIAISKHASYCHMRASLPMKRRSQPCASTLSSFASEPRILKSRDELPGGFRRGSGSNREA